MPLRANRDRRLVGSLCTIGSAIGDARCLCPFKPPGAVLIEMHERDPDQEKGTRPMRTAVAGPHIPETVGEVPSRVRNAAGLAAPLGLSSHQFCPHGGTQMFRLVVSAIILARVLTSTSPLFADPLATQSDHAPVATAATRSTASPASAWSWSSQAIAPKARAGRGKAPVGLGWG
jgi:hypothetical protein